MLAGSSTCAQTRLHAYDPKASAKEGLPFSVEKIQQVNGEQDNERRLGSVSGVSHLYPPSKLPSILSKQYLLAVQESPSGFKLARRTSPALGL